MLDQIRSSPSVRVPLEVIGHLNGDSERLIQSQHALARDRLVKRLACLSLSAAKKRPPDAADGFSGRIQIS
jgi:hypothetical protein